MASYPCSWAHDPSSHFLSVHTAWEQVCPTAGHSQHCPWPLPGPHQAPARPPPQVLSSASCCLVLLSLCPSLSFSVRGLRTLLALE